MTHVRRPIGAAAHLFADRFVTALLNDELDDAKGAEMRVENQKCGGDVEVQRDRQARFAQIAGECVCCKQFLQTIRQLHSKRPAKGGIQISDNSRGLGLHGHRLTPRCSAASS